MADDDVTSAGTDMALQLDQVVDAEQYVSSVLAHVVTTLDHLAVLQYQLWLCDQ